MKALITGSGGLIGSECARVLCRAGWDVVGIDNDMRAQFFGPEGTTRPVVEELIAAFPNYRHFSLDIRDRQEVRDLLRHERPDFIIHTAAQPSHDKAATIPYDDFEVYNLGGGRQNSLSILETIAMLADMGFKMDYTYQEQHRIGDHICYISDLTKLRAHFPAWKLEYDLPRIVDELAERYTRQAFARWRRPSS